MIDWEHLTTLIGPRWRARDPRERERLADAKARQRGGHSKGKNHGTGRRNAQLRAARDGVRKKEAEQRAADFQSYIEQVRAYWMGERDTHP